MLAGSLVTDLGIFAHCRNIGPEESVSSFQKPLTLQLPVWTSKQREFGVTGLVTFDGPFWTELGDYWGFIPVCTS